MSPVTLGDTWAPVRGGLEEGGALNVRGVKVGVIRTGESEVFPRTPWECLHLGDPLATEPNRA